MTHRGCAQLLPLRSDTGGRPIDGVIGRRPRLSDGVPPPVLTVHVIHHGGHGYYVGDLVDGRDRPGLVAGEELGAWTGRGADRMGLVGTVEAPVFTDLLEGRHPDSGRALRQQRGASGVAGFDLTFAAPKSVSILHLLATGEIAGQVGAGHRAAVAEASDYLDRAGVGVRRSKKGDVQLLPSTGAVAGGFLHRTSRALDPHLHTHLVVANVTEGVDGSWSTVDGRRIFAHAPAAQGIYHARLRLELHGRLGAAWDVSPSGLGDVVGVDSGLRHLFSQRSASMDEYDMARFGRVRSRGLRQGTFHATRPDKDRTRTVEELSDQWRKRAAEFGYDLGALSRVVGAGIGHRSDRASDPRAHDRHAPDPSEIGRGRSERASSATAVVVDPDRIRQRVATLAARRATLSQSDLVAIVAASTPTGASAVTIESIASSIAEASGATLGSERSSRGHPPGGRGAPTHGRSPRWRTDLVAAAVGRDDFAVLDPARDAGPDQPLDRSAHVDRRPVQTGRARPSVFDLGR